MSDKNCDAVSETFDYSFLFDELKNLSGAELVAVEKYVRQTRIEKQLDGEDFGDKKFNVERKELITALFSQVWEKVDKYEKRYFGNRKFSPIDLLPKVFQKALQYNSFWIACTGDYHMCKKCRDFTTRFFRSSADPSIILCHHCYPQRKNHDLEELKKYFVEENE